MPYLRARARVSLAPAMTRIGASALSRVVAAVVFSAAFAGACARLGGSGSSGDATSCCTAEAEEISRQYRVAAIANRRFTHAELWSALAPATASPALQVEEIGRSVQGRAIRAVTYGSGPTTVLLWSQMHGDESTATMALADIIAWLGDARRGGDPLRARIASALTVVMVPMLNPDGAEQFQRENAVGVDVNRDARRLATPEGRALKQLRDSLEPDFGFNLHDQNARTLTEPGGRQVAIALLAPAAEESRSYGPGRARARLVAAGIAAVLAHDIPGRIARYDDAFNPRAFGDLMQQWGTSTVLIESGALPDDPQKQRLRALNVMAIVTALEMIASERYRAMDAAVYEALPINGRQAVDVVVRGAALVLPDVPPMQVDIALNYDDPVARQGPRLREVGDLSAVTAIDTVDAARLFLHPDSSMLAARPGSGGLRIGAEARFTLRRGASASSPLVRTFGGMPDERPR